MLSTKYLTSVFAGTFYIYFLYTKYIKKMPKLYCLIDKDSKTAGCINNHNNIQTECTPQKVFVASDSGHKVTSAPLILSPSTSLSSSNDIMSSVRDPTIDYNYFRAGRTQ